MDTAIRTLKLETTRGGGPMPLTIPVQQEVARKTLTPLFPNNWASHLLGVGGILCRQNRKNESKLAVAKRQRKEKPTKMEQRKV